MYFHPDNRVVWTTMILLPHALKVPVPFTDEELNLRLLALIRILFRLITVSTPVYQYLLALGTHDL